MKTQILVFSHHFVVKSATKSIRKVLYHIASDYTQFGFVFDPVKKKRIWQPTKTFAFYNEKLDEFRYHIGMYEKFIQLLITQEEASNYSIEYIPLYAPDIVQLPVNPKFILREDQEEASRFILENTEKNSHYPLLAMATGTGKFQPLSSPVKVPGGWKRMSDLKIGDFVTSVDGSPTRVTGIYPQGVQDIYRLRFFDGRSTLAGLEHLWDVYIASKEKHRKIVTTAELIRMLGCNSLRNRIYIPLPKSENSPDVELPIHPYLLGALLGDGSFRSKQLKFCKSDPFMIDKLQSLLGDTIILNQTGPYDWVIAGKDARNNWLKPKIRELGLNGKYSWEKEIPKQYLNASTKQRLELVQGLLDTDGTADKNGSISYCTTSFTLAKQFCYLIRSLGGIASILSKKSVYTYKGECKHGRLAYNVHVRYKTPSELFTLPRKKERTNDNGQYCKGLMLRLESIQAEGAEECQCISVDHPKHLYITDDFIVTHNTVTSLVTASRISYRLGVVVLSMYVDKWKSDIANTYLLDKKDILTIQGSDQLIDLTQLAVENEHHTEKLPKVIIFSLNTLSKWYSDYLKDSDMPKLMSFGFPPYELMEKLRIGTLIFDEAHQFLHAVCRTFCFIHIPKTISLTATLLSKDPAEIRIQNMMYPRHKRFEEIKMKQYIQCFACNYVIMNMHLAKIRTSEFGSNGTYSHPAFEKSLLAHRTLRQQYIDMIVDMVVKTYHDGYIQGDRCAVFVSTAKMADIICEAIKKKLPKYDTRTYLERDPIENMRDSDIRVTTILSGGTAHDVANLRVCIQTISIDSPKSNIQVLGRLRELKDRDVKFYYLYCESIPKQVDYHINRQTLYRSRVAKLLKVWLPPLKP